MSSLTSPSRPSLLRTLLVLALGPILVLTGIGLAPAAVAAPAGPRSPATFASGPENYARYVGQKTCDLSTKPGMAAMRTLVYNHYRVGSLGGIDRSCSTGGTSEHKEGRAWDWSLNVNNSTHRATANSFLTWLIGPDAKGVPAGNARRLGVMYVIWNKQTWKAYQADRGWQPYTGASPHTDHIHISLGWDGAMKRTSFWTGKTVIGDDFGPCQVYVNEGVAKYSGRNPNPCPAPKLRPAADRPRDLTSDGQADLITMTGGNLMLFPGTGRGAVMGGRRVASGWSGLDQVTGVGDIDRNGRREMVARVKSTGELRLINFNGSNQVSGWRTVGTGWNGMNSLIGPGDWNGDGRTDLIARQTATGALFLYPGNGAGGFRKAVQIGNNWNSLDLITGVGNFDGRGGVDLVARRKSDGALLLYPGTGRGGFTSARVIGTGWGIMRGLASPGDLDRNVTMDLTGFRADGTVWMYRGTGTGGFFRGSAQIGRGFASHLAVG